MSGSGLLRLSRCQGNRRAYGSSGGVDAVVFTAGIGENSVEIRQRICEASAWLGLELDPIANATGGPLITSPASKVSAWVIPTNEELMIARHMARLLGWK